MDMSRFRSLQQQSAAAQLRRTLNVMFPHSYIKLYHQPPHSVCTLFTIKQSARPSSFVSSSRYSGGPEGERLEGPEWSSFGFEASSEPSSRAHVIQLQDQLQASLVEHQARPVGLCPIRRAIYDQCFDELIRQVTVGCIEQGLLLFRIRNEMRSTLSAYRRLYESAVAYGLNKALDAKLEQLSADSNDPKVDELQERGKLAGANEEADGEDFKTKEAAKDLGATEMRLKEYYEGELAKRDGVISHQRSIIRALNQK